MSLIRRMRKQKAVWWSRDETPDRFGHYGFGNPVEIDCRWSDKAEQFRNPAGQQLVSTSVVYPDRVLAIGDRLMLGEMDSNLTDDPSDELEAYEIQQFEKIPNLRNTETLYKAYL